jgi:ubiquitin C-terminal hydrolase
MITPDVLVIHLRRFDMQNGRPRKINGVRFDESLSLSPWTNRLDDEYQIESVIQHHGNSVQEGHYDCCRAGQGGYVRFNDGQVTISRGSLTDLHEHAYVLFYVKKSAASGLPVLGKEVDVVLTREAL